MVAVTTENVTAPRTPAERTGEEMSPRLRAAGDQLMAAIDDMRALAGTGWEGTVDELVNLAFDETAELPERSGISPEQLQAVRERLAATGSAWCQAVVEATGPPLRIDRRRLDGAFHFMGNRSSPTFRRKLANAYDRPRPTKRDRAIARVSG